MPHKCCLHTSPINWFCVQAGPTFFPFGVRFQECRSGLFTFSHLWTILPVYQSIAIITNLLTRYRQAFTFPTDAYLCNTFTISLSINKLFSLGWIFLNLTRVSLRDALHVVSGSLSSVILDTKVRRINRSVKNIADFITYGFRPSSCAMLHSVLSKFLDIAVIHVKSDLGTLSAVVRGKH